MVSIPRGSRLFRMVGVIVTLGTFAGCSSDTSSGTATIPGTSFIVIETTLVPTTVAEPATTAASTIAPTTTAVAELFLRAGGVGTFNFGVAPDDLIAALTVVYGSPSADFIIDYVPDATYGYLRADDGSDSYVAPVRRSVCWGGPSESAPWYRFCVHSGGATSTAQVFTGWDIQCFECDPTSIPKTAAGLTAGSRASDYPASIIVGAALMATGCEQFAFGNDFDGIHLSLQSVGGSFGAFDASGTWVPSTPSPGDIVVSYMSTDGAPIARAGDCSNHAYTFAGL